MSHRGHGVNGGAQELPEYVAILGCGLGVFADDPLGPVTHVVVETARRAGHVDADYLPHFILLTGSVEETGVMRRYLKEHGVNSEGRVRYPGHAAPTLETRAEALWELLPHNGIPNGEHPLVLVVAPVALLPLVQLIFKQHAERWHHARLHDFRFGFRGVPIKYSASARSWLFRGQRRNQLWQWWARVYHRLWVWGFGEAVPKPKLS